MKTKTTTPNPAQAEAIETIFGPLLVIAGPGTGKTQLLSARVAHILEKTDTSPENILCLTFTESGATNMRTRLATLIKRAATKVHIHTYHSFGRTILGAFAHYSDQPTSDRTRPIDAVATYQILSDIQTALPSSDILKSAKISDLSATIRELKSARLTPKQVQKIAESNLEMSAGLNSALSPLFSSLLPRKYTENLPVFAQILEVLSTHISENPITSNIEPEANFLARDLRRLLDEQAATDKPSIVPLSKWKTTYFEKDENGAYRSKNFISNRKLLSLSHIYASYQAALAASDLFDYPDMIEQAITHLATNPGFRATLAERYQFILLDEFQDTNPSQFDLVKSLTPDDQPNIMAVGDDDQAIMEFQGADASNLLEFANHYKAKVITLTENYRSTQPILDFAKKISAQIADSFSAAHGIDKSLTAHNTSSTQISRHTFPAAPSEYDWLAQQILSLIKQGIDPSEIAILAPKHKYIAPLLPHLAAKNLPISYEKRENILEDPRISSLLLLAEYAHALGSERQSSHLLLPLLSSPHWGIAPLSVVTALDAARTAKRPALEYLAASVDEKLATLAAFLATLAVRSLDTPLELLLDYMTGAAPLDTFRSPYLEYYASDDISAFTLYENLSTLRETIMSHTSKDSLKLSDLVTTLAAYAAAKEPIVNSSPYRTASSAVSILSVHKAKGLEFSHVFLIALDDAAWGNAGGNNNTLTLPKNLAHIRHTGITEDERLRLLFVAATRAKTHLYLTSSEADFSGKPFIPLEYLEEADSISPLLPEGSQAIIVHKEETPPLSALKTHWSTPYLKSLPDLSLILKSRLETYRLSPTDLTTFIDIVYAGPLHFYTHRLLGAPQPPPDAKVEYGNLIHATLDHATKHKTLDLSGLLAYFSEQTEASEMSAGQKSAFLTEATANLPVIIEKLAPVLSSPTSISEVNFRSENVQVDGIPITGKIDLLLIDPATKEVQIIDFKTSAFDPKKTWTNNPTLLKYRLQLGFYKLLVENSQKFRGHKVTTASLKHLSPDPRGALTSRPYPYPPADEQELLALIKSVHAHITNLNFPDIPPDADRTIKDLRAFIATLLKE